MGSARLPAKHTSKQTALPQVIGRPSRSPTRGTRNSISNFHLHMYNLKASSNCTANMQDLALQYTQGTQHPSSKLQQATVTVRTPTLSIQTTPISLAQRSTPTCKISNIMVSIQESKGQPESSTADLLIVKLLHRQPAVGQHCLCSTPSLTMSCSAQKSCHLWVITEHPFKTCLQALAST